MNDVATEEGNPNTRGSSADTVIALTTAVSAGLIGHEPLVERLAIALLVGGHLLIEGPPGVGKTRAVKRLSEGLDCSFARIQCTPDLLPADLTGTHVFRPQSGAFEFSRGPLFHSLVLVDEINRAPPKVQSALLEAMAESQVTSGGETFKLPEPFAVAATQNSIEHEGTFPLPEAQLDRFLMHVLVDLPESETERTIIDLVEGESGGKATPVAASLDSNEIARARDAAAAIHVSPALKDFVVRLVLATREGSPLPDVRDAVQHAVSPRGSLALVASAKARAFLRGRDHALPDDVVALAPDILAHRLVPTWRAVAEGKSARGLVARLLEAVEPL